MKSGNPDPGLPLWRGDRPALLVEAAVTLPGISLLPLALGTAARSARTSFDEGIGHSVGGRARSVPVWQLYLDQLRARVGALPKSTAENWP